MVAPKAPIFKDFTGINNVDPPEKCKPGEVQTATNVDVDDMKRFLRRSGFASVYSGNVHSLWANPSFTVFREGADLKRLNANFTATTLRSGIVGSNSMVFHELNGRVYYSDGVITGVLEPPFPMDRTWGLEVPTQPVLTEAAGFLPEGRYLCALTFIREDAQESGALASVPIDITMGGITFNNIPVSADPGVFAVACYVSTTNGEVLYQAMLVENGTTSATYGGTGKEFNVRLETQHLTAPPPNQNIQYYNGRLYLASENVLFWTEAYLYELINIAHNNLVFDSRITLLAPVDDGIWIGTEKEHIFVYGKDPEQGFQRIFKSQYGAIEGSQVAIDDVGDKGEKVQGWIWAAQDGVYVGMPQGAVKNVTNDRYYYDSARRAVAFVKEADFSQYIVELK